MIFRLILFFLTCSTFFSCGIFSRFSMKNRKGNPATYHLKFIPPGTVKLKNGLMIDETEITNFNWMEYIYWTKRVFGEDSAKNLDIYIDTNVWKQTNACYRKFDTHYLSHPAYRDYPVVGITQHQALLFCKWRSDRVFEYILIRDGKLDWNPNVNATNYFTIESYFLGQYEINQYPKYITYLPDTNYKFVPRYWLPTVEEWSSAVEQNDLLECKKLGKSTNKIKRSCWENPFVNVEIKLCDTSNKTCVTAPMKSRCFKKSLKNYVYHLRGNVSEWTCAKDTCIGGGWKDSKNSIYKQPVIYQEKQNANTGFRCVCSWEKVRINTQSK